MYHIPGFFEARWNFVIVLPGISYSWHNVLYLFQHLEDVTHIIETF